MATTHINDHNDMPRVTKDETTGRTGENELPKLSMFSKIRIFLAPCIWLIYSIYFIALIANSNFMVENDDINSIKSKYPKSESSEDPEKRNKVIVGMAGFFWLPTFVVIQCFIASESIGKYNKKPFKLTWINVPLLAFLIMALPFYIYLLILSYSTRDNYQDEIEGKYYVLFHGFILAIVLGNIVYPLPKRRKQATVIASSLVMETLNAFDISDMLEDAKYFHTYDNAYLYVFYASITLSILLQAFPPNLNEEDKDSPGKWQLLFMTFMTFMTLVSMDIAFLVLRSVVMSNEGTYEGIHFAFKNVLSALWNIYFLYKVIKHKMYQ